MNDVTNFEALLNKPLDSFEAPKPLPAGSYSALIEKFEFGKSKNKETPYVRFFVKPTEGLDVDAEAIAEAGGFEGKALRLDFFLTPDAMFRLTKFADEHLGLDIAGRPTGEIIQEAVGCPLTIVVAHETSTRDASVVYANIAQTAKAAA